MIEELFDDICPFTFKILNNINKIINNKRLVDEQEVLFLLDERLLAKECQGITPIEFKKIIESQIN